MGNLKQSFFKTIGSFGGVGLSMERRFKVLRTKLEYEWPSIYRTLVSRDLDQLEAVSVGDFKGALLRAGIYLDRESWKTILRHFGEKEQILYKEMSMQLGLHRAGFESISSVRL